MSNSPKTVTTFDLARMKREGEKIVMLTAYDALFASLVDSAGVDVVLVGDSVNTVLCGEDTTLSATLEQMLYHGRIVRAGVQRALVIVDMPFLSYQVSVEDARRNTGRVLKETGAHGVKLEGGKAVADTIRALTDVGIPVMGHLGFTPQSVHQVGGYRVQGRGSDAAERIVTDAKLLQDAGVFSIVLELTPSDVAKRVSEAVDVPTIGIGSGPHCDGQVLVLHDMLGLNQGFEPKFLKRYAELAGAVRQAVESFGADVRAGRYPDASHSYDA
jgi:3-methyl-2-oxobutanoate hydroxymethyltransferase